MARGDQGWDCKCGQNNPVDIIVCSVCREFWPLVPPKPQASEDQPHE